MIETGIDHTCVGDHVSFHVGAGSDALIDATAVLSQARELPCYVALYLLPLRHPVLVARQLASIGELAPGRLTLGWVSAVKTVMSWRSAVSTPRRMVGGWTKPCNCCGCLPKGSR